MIHYNTKHPSQGVCKQQTSYNQTYMKKKKEKESKNILETHNQRQNDARSSTGKPS